MTRGSHAGIRDKARFWRFYPPRSLFPSSNVFTSHFIRAISVAAAKRRRTRDENKKIRTRTRRLLRKSSRRGFRICGRAQRDATAHPQRDLLPHTHTNLSRVQFTYACLCLCVYVICMYVNVDKMDVDGKGMMARKTGIGTNIGVRAGRAFRALFRFFRMRESNRN